MKIKQEECQNETSDIVIQTNAELGEMDKWRPQINLRDVITYPCPILESV